MTPGVLVLLLALSHAGIPVQSTALPVGTIEVTGTQRFKPADAAAISGLTPQKPVTGADIESAAKRMADSGLFKRVGFRYGAVNGRWTITFEIEDFEWSVPVILDNFIWFTDDEIMAWLRAAVPTFDGKAPNTTQAADLIAASLQKLLESRKVGGRIEFLPEGDLRSMRGYVFRVVNPAPAVCAWQFNGAAAIQPAELESALSEGRKDYSRTFVTRASRGTVTTLYRRLGYWRADVSTPRVTVITGTCMGVTVAIDIREGARYDFDGVRWTGNGAIPAKDLDDAFGMKRGDAASLTKLEDGLRRIDALYGKIGYITERATPEEQLDDSAHKAVFAIRVQEGPQFHMGTVEFPGLPPADAAALKQRWRLKTGDVYDATYASKFVTDELLPRLPRGTKPPPTRIRADPAKQTVDVQFVFGG